ncbi:MAG: hypothetical protein EX271_03065 [Acidimicrobiales bacterium]|nr:EamA family transporter [Hyphomonadaceae bacterium]RZV43863.1 MAG: hypothetical protein EX271_03065 [Acidimicrobiales bacterium]
MPTTQYNKSVLMVILGGMCLSLLGIADRNMEAATGPQIALYRAVGQTVFFSFVFWALKKNSVAQEFRDIGRRGWAAAAIMAAAGFFLIMSFQYTLVANAIFFVSLTPLFAAMLGWIFLRERVSRRTGLALAIALLGVTIIFGTNMNGEGVIGMALAMMMAVCYAASIVIVRTIPHANIILICTLNAALTIVAMLFLVDGFAITRNDLLICLGLGVVQIGLGGLFVLMGARHVPAAQVSILALVEVVLSPLWVWLFAGETPSATTLIGGAVVLAGVVYQALGARNMEPVETHP